MKRLRRNFLGGQLSEQLDSNSEVMVSSSLSLIPVVTDGVDYLPITINPDGEENFGSVSNPEIAYVIEHTLGSDTATLLRGQEGTNAVTWQESIYWQHAPTAKDFSFVINTDGDPGETIYIGSTQPTTENFDLQVGDFWIEV